MAAVVVGTLLAAEAGARLLADHVVPPPVWRHAGAEVKEERIDQLARRGGASVVFLGSSMVDVAADAARLPAGLLAGTGRPAYNASLFGVATGALELWGLDVVAPRLRPDLVVLGLSSRELNGGDVGTQIADDALLGSPEAHAITGDLTALGRLDRWTSRWSYLVRYRRVLRAPASVVRGRDGTAGYDAWTEQGFDTEFRGREYADRSVFAPLFEERLRRFEIDPRRLDQARRLVEGLVERGTAVLVVSMPVTADYVAFHPGGAADHAAATAALRAVAAEGGAEFLDLGVWPRDRFVDPVHLADAGVDAFAAAVAPAIGTALDRS